jgi:hypothetical protein
MSGDGCDQFVCAPHSNVIMLITLFSEIVRSGNIYFC